MMKQEKVLQVIEGYQAKLCQMEIKPEQSDTDPLARAAWCLEQMPEFLMGGRREKVMRWLGFVQGVLFAEGIFSVEELKNHLRPDEKIIMNIPGCALSEEQVLEILQGEREYQKRRWGRHNPDGTFTETRHSMGDWITILLYYSRKADLSVNSNLMEQIRKIGALGLAYFEQEGIEVKPRSHPKMVQGEYLCNIRYLLHQADTALYQGLSDTRSFINNVVDEIATRSIWSMMVHGCPPRDLSIPIINGLAPTPHR